jgi:hypothetical protein
VIVVGARFRAFAAARAALRAVRASVAGAAGDVGVRPLGTTRYEAPVDEFVVAGRFQPEDVETVIRILHANGGRVVARRADRDRVLPTTAPVAQDGPARSSAAGARRTLPRRASRSDRSTGAATDKRLRRPSPPLRVRTARGHRIER